MIHSLEQDRAKYALRRVENYTTESELWRASYLRQVKRLSAMILTCGLGQSTAYLIAQSVAKEGKEQEEKKAVKQLYKDIETWLCCESHGIYSDGERDKDLMHEITNGDMEKYMNTQAEVLSLLVWLKKMAVAYLSGPESGVSNESATL
ncbi:MAG: type III-B CRISPR module-associated protein Cmr5 [Bacillota bacterium]|jgi:CRISPR type III-B/RAMP module-associated protein Cmr5